MANDSNILNADFVFSAAPAQVVGAFRGSVEKRLIGVGAKLFKFTDTGRTGDRVSPWWLPHAPMRSQDTGYAGLAERASRLAVSESTFIRARNAVTHEWNTMESLLIVVVNQPVWGFYGLTRSQRVTTGIGNVAWIGGGYQLWIPNLKLSDITPLT
jgi:hypothetical protein